MAKCPHVKHIKETHPVDLEKNGSQLDEQTYGQTKRTDFIPPISKRWRFDHVFQKLENKASLNYLA